MMLRKFDPAEGILVYGHIVVNLAAKGREADASNFTIGLMSNDDIKARSTLNAMLEIPPSFHRRSEVRLIERKWRSDSEAVMRFLANIHSAMAQLSPSGKVYTLKFEPPPGMMGELKRNLGVWWE